MAQVLPGCIIMTDNRIKIPIDQLLKTYLAEDNSTNDLLYSDYSRITNKLYADTHGYKFVESDLTNYSHEDRGAPWFKLLVSKQQVECCCQWALCDPLTPLSCTVLSAVRMHACHIRNVSCSTSAH